MNEIDSAPAVGQDEHDILAVEELLDELVQPARIAAKCLPECHGSRLPAVTSAAAVSGLASTSGTSGTSRVGRRA